MARYYRSVPAAMWMTLLNLTGECPLVDYQAPGRIVIGLMGLVGGGFFCIPFGLLSGGLQDELEDDEEDEDAGAPGPQTGASGRQASPIAFDHRLVPRAPKQGAGPHNSAQSPQSSAPSAPSA